MKEIILKFTVDDSTHERASGLRIYTNGSVKRVQIQDGDAWSEDVAYFFLVHMLADARRKLIAEIDSSLATIGEMEPVR